MQPPNPWQSYPFPPEQSAPQWQQRIVQIEQQLGQLSTQLKGMQDQLNELKNKPPLHVEYHFDQLKVNRLEGTLNVGISPQGMPSIDSLETPNTNQMQDVAELDNDTEQPLRIVQQEMSTYMQSQAPNILIDLEQQYQITLDRDERTRVINDVNKQLEGRVRYYATMSTYPSQGTNEERQQWSRSIKEKTIRDVHGAFSTYLSKQQQATKGDVTAHGSAPHSERN
ncbi:MAG: spore germination protein GerPC [Candidatus Cohnella colombiensis]|uniref:Spore germination protein GerPC n=1 Tax=Candidatus Cohnella colombiensis TaxID=3121368 RepID=A0AA95EY17_9BACL|nr:MAG: spore germination protein GerPC [Cohnella sp.]